jgi:glycosyltransferase involved in cell wall biosynthesis
MGNVRTQRGHGQGFALNFGAGQARGDYLCFLDDDQWTDPDAKANMTTVESELSKQLSRLRVFDKVVPFSVRPEI